MALAASHIVAGDTGEFWLSSQNWSKFSRINIQEESLFKSAILNFQTGVLGIWDGGITCNCREAWSDRTIESIKQSWTLCKKLLGIKK